MSEDPNNAPPESPCLADRLGQACVELRPDLEASRHVFRGEVCYILIDPITFTSHRFARADYAILTRLRASAPLHVIFESLVAGGELSEDAGERFYAFIFSLHKTGLLNLPISDEKTLYDRHLAKKKAKTSKGFKSALFFQVPILDPDALLSRTANIARPFFSRYAFAAWLVLVSLAGWVVARNWGEFAEPVGDIFRNENLPLLWISLIVLKVAHEFGHAYATKLLGGHVPEMGLFMMIFTPCAYVDSTAAWGFSRKRDRLIVNFAGMYVELCIAAAAVLVWSVLPPGLWRSVLHNVVMLASVITVGFNINPLMRYDGYYALSDFLEIPNLRSRSQAEGIRMLKRVVLGVHTDGEQKGGLRAFLVLFGFFSAIYKVTLVLGISATIALKFPAIGLAMGGAYMLGEIWGILRRSIPYLWGSQETATVRSWAMSLVLLILIGMPVAVAAIPVPSSVVTRGVLSAETDLVLRSEASGFLSGVSVKAGEVLSSGQVVVQLEDHEASSRLAEVQARLEAAELILAQVSVLDPAARTQQRARVRQLEREVAQRASEVERLTIRSPLGSTVVEMLDRGEVGRFVTRGEPIASLIAGRVVVRALLSEEQLVASLAKPGALAEFRTSANLEQIWRGEITRVLPAGQRELDPTFTRHLDLADYGVNPATGLAARSQFEVEMALDRSDEAQALPRGLTGHIRIVGVSEPLGLAIVRKALTFLRRLTS